MQRLHYSTHYKVILDMRDTQEVEGIIQALKALDVDGETMQFILDRVGMNDQMLRQLAFRSSTDNIFNLLKEKFALGY